MRSGELRFELREYVGGVLDERRLVEHLLEAVALALEVAEGAAALERRGQWDVHVGVPIPLPGERCEVDHGGAAEPVVVAPVAPDEEQIVGLRVRGGERPPAEALGTRFRVYAREDSVAQPGEVVEDDFLIKADKNPNSHGVRERFGWRTLTAADAQGHDLFLVWGDWGDYAGLGSAPVIHLASFARQGDRHADVHIPVSTTFERSGTFSNFEGKRNRFDRVLDKPPLVAHAADVFVQIEAELAGLQRLEETS